MEIENCLVEKADLHEFLTTLILKAAENSQTKPIPSSLLKIRSPTIWWDKECSEIVKQRSEAFKKFRKLGRIHDLLNYKKLEAKSKMILKAKKRNFWKQFVESLTTDTAMPTLWQAARRLRNFNPNTTDLHDFNADWIDQFAENVSPCFVPNEKPIFNEISPSAVDLIADFGLTDLENALVSCNNSSPGMDGIKFSLLKNLPTSAKQLLLRSYNWIFQNKSIPATWQDVKVVAILKPGKESGISQSYRPIGLLSCTRKVLEKMILVRLEFWAEKHQLLSPTQYGFRQGKGTRDCQALFATDIQIAFRSKQALTAVFLDIKGAYDSVLIDILCQKLCVLGIPARLAEFLFDLLSFKVMHFIQNFQIKHVRNSFSGLTQGSSLSPLLYNLYTRDIDNCIESGCVLVQYADDACLWASAKDVKLSERPLQICLNKLTTWASDLGLEFSASKTELLYLQCNFICTVFSYLRVSRICISDYGSIRNVRGKFMFSMLYGNVNGV